MKNTEENSEKMGKIWKKGFNIFHIFSLFSSVFSKFSISFHISTYFFFIFSSYLPLPSHFIFIICARKKSKSNSYKIWKIQKKKHGEKERDCIKLKYRLLKMLNTTKSREERLEI
jgi:hypothetical protein